MRRSAAQSFFLAVFALLGSSSAATKSHPSNPDVCAFEPGAKVSDACASYADLDALNSHLHPYIHNLATKTDFFSYYRLNLYNKVCPFWSDENGLCGNIACAVTTLENEADIPDIWRAEELSRLEGPKAHHPDRQEQRDRQQPLMGELGEGVGESCVVEYDDDCDDRDYCVPEDESSSAKGDYVSLVDNPERFTGYAGEGAHQVWEAIYRENCFEKHQSRQKGDLLLGSNLASGHITGQQAQAALDFRSVMKEHGRQQMAEDGGLDDGMEFEDECLEKRVFYRVISGMHASISIHLCHDYLNQTTGQWGPNLECYKRRLDKHPERISNLYFNYAFVLRAVGKLRDYVQDYTFCSGDPVEDRRTKRLITTLADTLPAGPEIFDESVMFQFDDHTETGITLKEDFRSRFRNVSRIMDCVGCDKCRLWGKLQTAGYGTALKVLFEFGDPDETKSKPLLRRTELVALINTLDKISSALEASQKFRRMIEAEAAPSENNSGEARIRQYWEDEDDLDEDAFEDDEPSGKRRSPDTVTDIFWDEWNRFWRVYMFVLKQWLSLPKKLWHICLEESDRLLSYWLGLRVRPRAWSVNIPRVEEL